MKKSLTTAAHRALVLVTLAGAAAVSLTSLGCSGSEESPFAGTGTPPPGGGATPAPTGTGTGGTGTTPPPAGDAGGTDPFGGSVGAGIGCGKSPARYVMLGHSVAHCFAVGGVDSETCSSKNVHTLLATRFPGLTYENYAVDGALVAGVVSSQLPKIEGGAGHVFVNVFIGGNDLAAHLYEADAQAQKSWETLRPKAIKDFQAIFAFFDDKAKFPGGATIMVNAQYNPFDECVAGQYAFVTAKKQAIVVEFNGELAKIVAGHPNSAMVDQYTSYLGHGHNYNQSQCPKYVAGNEGWMADLIHPNAKGHVNLTREMTSVVDKIYKCP